MSAMLFVMIFFGVLAGFAFGVPFGAAVEWSCMTVEDGADDPEADPHVPAYVLEPDEVILSIDDWNRFFNEWREDLDDPEG